jgi:hypothetical protein
MIQASKRMQQPDNSELFQQGTRDPFWVWRIACPQCTWHSKSRSHLAPRHSRSIWYDVPHTLCTCAGSRNSNLVVPFPPEPVAPSKLGKTWETGLSWSQPRWPQTWYHLNQGNVEQTWAYRLWLICIDLSYCKSLIVCLLLIKTFCGGSDLIMMLPFNCTTVNS